MIKKKYYFSIKNLGDNNICIEIWKKNGLREKGFLVKKIGDAETVYNKLNENEL